MSFLKIGDRAAGAIKSGGTTRRAAKMVVVDVDHPDIEAYIDWKVKRRAEGRRARHRLQDRQPAPEGDHEGLRQLRRHMAMTASIRSINPALKREIQAAKKVAVPENYVKRVIQFARQGYTDIEFQTYDTDWDSEAYLTVSGQNSNNSVSLKDDFLRAVETDGDWNLTARKDGKVMKTLKARDLWEKIGYCRLGVGRSGPALQHDHERLAHLPGGRADPRVQSVLGIHVPRRHGLQPCLAEPACSSATRPRHRPTARLRCRQPTSMPAGCG